MKLIMASSIAFLYPTKFYEKPLNPVLGETYEATAGDGAKIYLEQTSHHPPVTSFLVEGPNGAYTITGYSTYKVHSGLNNATVVADGYKKIVFHDGHTVQFNCPGDYFYNLLMGTMGHQITGTIEFTDKSNNIKGEYTFGTLVPKWKTQDYFTGKISQNGQQISEIFGNYMGYMDIDKQRYYDLREIDKVYRPLTALGEKSLPSDATKRRDSVILKTLAYDKAQEAKVEIEELQRKDRRSREACNKRRQEGGPKFAFMQSE